MTYSLFAWLFGSKSTRATPMPEQTPDGITQTQATATLKRKPTVSERRRRNKAEDIHYPASPDIVAAAVTSTHYDEPASNYDYSPPSYSGGGGSFGGGGSGGDYSSSSSYDSSSSSSCDSGGSSGGGCD